MKSELKYLFEKEKSKNEKKFARIESLKTTTNNSKGEK